MPPKKRNRSPTTTASSKFEVPSEFHPSIATIQKLASQPVASATSLPDWVKVVEASTSVAIKAVAFKKPRAAALLTSNLLSKPRFSLSGLQPARDSLLSSTKDEMEKLVQFKLARGMFRPGLLQQFQSNAAKDAFSRLTVALAMLEETSSFEVKELIPDAATTATAADKDANAAVITNSSSSSSKSLSEMADHQWKTSPMEDFLKKLQQEKNISGADQTPMTVVPLLKISSLIKAVQTLSELKGVGPATATIFLAASEVNLPEEFIKKSQPAAASTAGSTSPTVISGVCPFMADESMQSLGLPLTYTVPALRVYFEGIRQIHLAQIMEEAAAARKSTTSKGQQQTIISPAISEAQIAEGLWASRVLGSLI